MRVIHETEIYVRYCESDALGHVNNTSHFVYFEEARTRFLSEVYSDRTDSFAFVVASICCNYLNEAFPKQTLNVITTVKKIGNKSFTLEQVLKDEENNLIIAEADTILVSYDNANKRSIQIPNVLRKNLDKQLIVYRKSERNL